jgi:Tfp pilus assembly protein PilV
MTRGARRGERGTTLVEVMVAGAVLLVALVGFVGTSRYAATATAVGHRRTVTTLLRAELMDRLAVMPRSSLSTLAGYSGASLVYVVDSCYDVDGRLLKSNAGYSSSTYACDAPTTYRSWVAARDAGNSTWTLAVYVERMDQGCTPATRYSSVGCSGADLLLTD